MRITVNSKNTDTLRKIAETFGKLRLKGREITGVYLNPIDFYQLRLNPTFYDQFDAESQRKLVRQGVVGYLWGSVIKLDLGLKVGILRFSTEAIKSIKAA